MNKDTHLQNLLDEINSYIDNLPPPGSSEYLRFTELCSEISDHRAATPEHPLARELDQLGRKIDEVARRRQQEKHAHDLTPDGQAMPPLIGGYFGPS